MENNEKIDFYSYGMRCGKDRLLELSKIAKKIAEEYGIDAKLEFESGVVSIISQYSNVEYLEKPFKTTNDTYKTIDETKENYRNNSYFGEYGISRQERDKKNSSEYNEPTIKR